MWLFVQQAFWYGWRPVSMDMREGTQMGEGQYTASSVTPCGGEAVEVRGLHHRIAVAAGDVGAVLVGEEVQDVGPAGPGAVAHASSPEGSLTLKS